MISVRLTHGLSPFASTSAASARSAAASITGGRSGRDSQAGPPTNACGASGRCAASAIVRLGPPPLPGRGTPTLTLRRLRSAPLRPLQWPPPSLQRRQPAPGAAPAPAANAALDAPAQLARRRPQKRCKRGGSTPPKSSKQKFGLNRRHFVLSAREPAILVSILFRSKTCLRPYSVKRTVSRPICEVKPLQATSVLRWGTTWESGVP